jgi:hypothetical protein
VAGVTALDVKDGSESPTKLVATTLNVYETPLVKPVNIRFVPVPVEIEAVAPAGVDVTV